MGIRDAMEIIEMEMNMKYLARLGERDLIYGESAALELNLLVAEAR